MLQRALRLGTPEIVRRVSDATETVGLFSHVWHWSLLCFTGKGKLRRFWAPQPNPRFFSLEIDLRPESADESAPSNPAHIGIVLNHWLNQQRSRKHQDVQLNAVLGLPGRHAGGEALRAKDVSHIAQQKGVEKAQGQRLVEGQPRRELRVVAVDIRRTPVERKCYVQTSCFFGIDAPQSLARLPV